MTAKKYYVGKTILIGLTVYEADGAFLGQEQKFGKIAVCSETNIEVKLDDGSTYDLPPDTSVLEPAAKGEYRLRATGKVVTDPDFICSYTVTKPVKH